MKKIYTILAILAFASLRMSAATGDTINVITHNDTLVVTNPNTGNNPYRVWAVFPADSIKYRKVILHLSYHCPSGMTCGAWDYIDNVFLRRMGGVNGDTANIEVTRFITPYGGSFSQTWHAEWHMDVTDYALLLHDSVEVEYMHTGYETNNGVGWKVSVSFEFIEGTPVMEPVALRKMWNGNFAFGNASNPIDSHLQPITFNTDSLTNFVRLRLVQSGHGSDANGCSEFCYPVRYVLYDGVQINSRTFKRLCGTNPLYPQAGTWIYDRGNWCPGALVYADAFTYPVTGGSSHSFDINMQNYTVASPSGNYYFESELMEFGPATHTNDASIEEIYAPSDIFENSRNNPVCSNPQILLRNNGSTALTSAQIKYGLEGQTTYTYNWSGNLATTASVTVNLSNIIVPAPGTETFRAYLSSVNGIADDYPYDDTATSTAVIPPTLDSVVVFQWRTNNNVTEDTYVLRNDAGAIVYQRTTSGLTANTIYRDTFRLATGCYNLVFTDAGNDGLSFWNNGAQGTGYARIQNLSGVIIKQFNPDFGKEFRYNFFVDTATLVGVIDPEVKEAQMLAYPNPSNGILNVELYNPKNESLKISVMNSMGQVIYEEKTTAATSRVVDLDLSSQAAGVYFIKAESASVSVVRRWMLVH